jgi:hypothetical protein
MNLEVDRPDAEAEVVRSLLDDLLEKSCLYKQSKDYQELLDQVAPVDPQPSHAWTGHSAHSKCGPGLKQPKWLTATL